MRFPTDAKHPSGKHFHPADPNPQPGQTNSYGVNDHYRRVGEQLVGPWQLAASAVLTYDAPSPWLPSGGGRAGKTTMPAALPGGHMLFVWSPGEVHVAGGQTAYPDMKVCYAKDGRLDDPQDVIVLKENSSYHYMHPKPVVEYFDIYGIVRPKRLLDTPNDGTAHPFLPKGSPMATTGTSSVYNRESSWPASYTDAWSQPLINNYGQITAFRNVGQDTYRFENDDIYAAQVVVDMARVDTRYVALNGNFRTHNIGQQIWGVLGEIPVRKTNAQGQTVLDPLGNPDTSYEVRIPANVPFHHRILDRDGLTLTSEQTWHSARPGERKIDCGGCHAHSVDTPFLQFSQTAAARPGYNVTDFALQTPMLDRDAQGRPTVTVHPEKVRIVEYFRDVKPILDAKCASCHAGPTAPKGLDLSVSSAWDKLAYKRDPKVPYQSSHQATRYVRYNSATQSSLVWKIFGRRLDGRTNAERSDDWDYLGDIMPPPGSPPLTFEEKRTIALWVDLGCVVDLTPGVSSPADPFDDQMKPSLVLGGIRTDYNEAPVPPLTVSAYDAHSGIDPQSLSIVITRANGQKTLDLAAGMNVQEGQVYQFDINARLAGFADYRHTIDISIADQAGNVTRRKIELSPLSLDYRQTTWPIGGTARLTVDRAKPNETVVFLGSHHGLGNGPRLFRSNLYGGDFTLDLIMPIWLLAAVPASAQGSASFDVSIPGGIPPIPFFTQAVVFRGRWLDWSVKTQPLWADIQ